MTTFPSLLSTKKTQKKNQNNEIVGRKFPGDRHIQKQKQSAADRSSDRSIWCQKTPGDKELVGTENTGRQVVQEKILSVIRSGPATSSTYSPPHLPMPKVVVLLAITWQSNIYLSRTPAVIIRRQSQNPLRVNYYYEVNKYPKGEDAVWNCEI